MLSMQLRVIRKMQRMGPSFLMHMILDHLVDDKYKAFDNMEDDLEEAGGIADQ